MADPTYDIIAAANRLGKENYLAGLNDAIIKVRAFRLSAESCAPESSATSMIMFRVDRLIDDLETRAALLQKQIGG